MKISSALVDVTLELVAVKDRNAKQLEAEKIRLKQSSGTNEKLDVLIQKKNEDVLPDTRSICITELGNWMLVYPDHFLEDSYLKYIGWSLYDKVPDVRLKCISALLPLYDKPDVLMKLELFTNKFKDRLVSMVLDKDNEVGMKTCQLMTSIYRTFPTLLQLKDCVPIYELVYSNHRGLAVAAGEFLNTKVFQHSQRSRASSVTSSGRGGMGDNAKLIQDLIQFYIEGECHEHATYLVDALIDTNPMIKDWQTMVDLLLSDEVESSESQLIEVLVCSVRQAATGDLPVGRSVVKRGAPSTKESRTLVEDRTRLSEVLIPALPKLLQKVPDVRLKCISALLPLYDKPDVLMKLELFTNKFKDRLVSMVLDKDNEVGMKTCQLMTSIYRTFPTLLQLKDCVPIYELVYSNHRGLAVAAGEFLNTKVFQHSQRSRASSVTSSGRGGMVESSESQLIEVLVCSVRQAATGDLPVGRSVVKRGAPSTKESRTLVEDRTRLSEVLIPALPKLLQKFIADRDKVANLITLPLNFQLDMYMAGRLENHLNELMRVIDMVVEKHADEEMMNTVAEMITYFSTNTSVAQNTETYRLKLIDGLALQLRHTVQRCMNEDQWDEEDEAAMLAAFRKITAFASHIDLKKWDLWDVVLHVLNNHDDKAPRDVIDKSIWFLFMQLNWDLVRLVRDQEPNKTEAVKKLKKRRDQFLHDVNIILSEGASGVELAFQCLNDSL
ncbi:hypothetical protein OSTOST_06975, partial [Ostertagia ostertagi]